MRCQQSAVSWSPAAGLAGTATAIVSRRRRGRRRPDRRSSRSSARSAPASPCRATALRELRQLGVWDAVLAAGYPFDSLGLRAPDPAGTLLAEIPDARTGGPDLPATVGLPRPALARILADRAAAAGAKLPARHHASARCRRTPTAWTSSSPTARPAAMTWSSARTASGRRPGRMLGITDEPRPTGMGIFRAFGPRPASVTRTDLYYGGPAYIAGLLPDRARTRCTRTSSRTRRTGPR